MKTQKKHLILLGLGLSGLLGASLYYNNVSAQNALQASALDAARQNIYDQQLNYAANETGGGCMACPAMEAISYIDETGQVHCEKVQSPAGKDPKSTTPAGYKNNNPTTTNPTTTNPTTTNPTTTNPTTTNPTTTNPNPSDGDTSPGEAPMKCTLICPPDPKTGIRCDAEGYIEPGCNELYGIGG